MSMDGAAAKSLAAKALLAEDEPLLAGRAAPQTHARGGVAARCWPSSAMTPQRSRLR
ncbi:MAG: hypothetical protein ABI212_02085 [Burkholderiaceae bacterium]